MQRQVLLARHGHHAEVGRALSGRSPIPLDPQGEREAAALAHHLAEVPLVAVFASPRPRTVETAAAVALPRAMEVRRASALDEIDFGDFTGRDFATLADDPAWRAWNEQRATVRCPGGETMAEAVARAVGFLTDLPAGISLCVTHCDVIRGVVAHWLGLGFERMFQLGCDPGSVTTLALNDDGGATVIALNERPRQARG